ncbi:MAG: family 16 glycosylhydrolase [Proteobacteria bacterium]|nr:family 16 glycosylhydrolase [Pseudomonadota bacterium]
MKSIKLFICLLPVASSLAIDVDTASADRWEIVIGEDALDNYSNLEEHWNYLYPWGSDHNGTARMYGSSADHNHIYISNGVLTLKASRINWDEGNSTAPGFSHIPIHYHSGAIHSKHLIVVNDRYPNYELEARIQAPSRHGTWPAFWATGRDSWPPETDIMEYKGSNVNWQNTYDGGWEEQLTRVANPGTWHTYRIWMTKINSTDVHIHYYIDGQWKARHTGHDFVNKPMHIILNLQMEGSSGGSGPHGSTYMNVDWVRVGRTVADGSSEPVQLHRHCNYGGDTFHLSSGRYTLSELNARGIRNDDISSLRVQSGYRVTLYQHDQFMGSSIVKTADDGCLVDDGFNDQMSSLIIESDGR